ncbi:MAG: hypothetical protein LBR83_01490 [Clostridiales bacterium]|jgi:hypothetical protein|nr:hypothetical protein [Clostridiales bacterium]
MSVETRHKEKEFLFKLLSLDADARSNKSIKLMTRELIATMEPEDVELVKLQIKEMAEDESKIN